MFALGKASTDWLLDPYHVGQIYPIPRVVCGHRSAAILPRNWAVLLQQTLERGAAWAAIQKNANFLACSLVLRREEPEVELRSFVGFVADG